MGKGDHILRKADPMARERKRAADLAVTWRIYQRRSETKDFWVDLKGNVWDYH
jgi:hypothetical protein